MGLRKTPVYNIDVTPLGAPSGGFQAPNPEPADQPVSLVFPPEKRPQVPRAAKRPYQAPPVQPRIVRPRSKLLFAMTYLLGATSPLVMRQGRQSFVWALLGWLSVATWVGTIWRWTSVQAWLEGGTIPLLPWLIGMIVVTITGFTACARTVYCTGRDERFIPERLPTFVRQPILTTALGFLLPGSGLLISGHPRRASMAMWNIGPTIMAGLILWRASWLWDCNRASGAQGLPLLALESIFIGSAAVCFLGALFWLGGALDGGRLTAHRSGQRASARADWLAFAAMASMLAFVFTLGPSQLARNLDSVAMEMKRTDYRLIPLFMEQSAQRLDPSRPKYQLEAAQLYDLIGKHEKARQLRQDLSERWKIYAEMLLQQNIASDQTLRPSPIPHDLEGETSKSR